MGVADKSEAKKQKLTQILPVYQWSSRQKWGKKTQIDGNLTSPSMGVADKSEEKKNQILTQIKAIY